MLYTFLRWCPGALGLLLRQKLYPRYVKECGRNVLFGRFVNIRDGGNTLSIGSGVVVNDFVTLQGDSENRSGATLIIEDNVFIGAGTTITATRENILIRSGSNIGSCCVVQSDTPVVLESNVLIAAFCEIGKKHYEDDPMQSEKEPGNDRGEKVTTIEQGCWLGVRARIAAGLHIGEGTIIGAHSTVTTDLPDHVVAIGDPAEVLHKRE